MSTPINGIRPPEQGVYRLAWRPGDVFAPPPWSFSDPIDGTFKNRFDDPSLEDGHGPDQRFRMVYCATERRCTLMESTARFRRSVSFLAKLGDDLAELEEPVGSSLSGLYDADSPSRGVIPASWRHEHQIGHTHLDGALRFLDLTAASSLNHLRHAMADVLLELGLGDIDLSAVTGPDRKLTQRIARYIYEQIDAEGNPCFAGIRYLSRYGDNQECWAIFDTRIVHSNTSVEQSIIPDDEDLLAVANVFGLSIEILDGHYLRP